MWKRLWPSNSCNAVKCLGMVTWASSRRYLQSKAWEKPASFLRYSPAEFATVHGRCFAAKAAARVHPNFSENATSTVCNSTQMITQTGISLDRCSCSRCSTLESSKLSSDLVGETKKLISEKSSSGMKSEQLMTSVHDVNQVDSSVASQKPGLLKRFKMMYKQYGVIMFCVHWSTASVWTAMFYYAAIRLISIDLVRFLRMHQNSAI